MGEGNVDGGSVPGGAEGDADCGSRDVYFSTLLNRGLKKAKGEPPKDAVLGLTDLHEETIEGEWVIV